MKKPSKTINRLHFEDLDPLRFEDLCLNIISRLHGWKEINHYGRKGADLGVDILAKKQVENGERVWFIQCKRRIKIQKSDIKKIVDTIVESQQIPDKLLVIVSCDVSKSIHEYFKIYAAQQGIQDSELWTASVLETKLYKDYKDLLFVYFGIQLQNKSVKSESRIKQSLRMEKRVKKELIDHEFLNKNKNFKLLMFQPWLKFISRSVFIRSVYDTTYPERSDPEPGSISPWFKTWFYDTYHNGIELWINAPIGPQVLMDKDGYWEELHDRKDERISDPKYKVVLAKQIARIPYYNIVDFKTNGDEYSTEPHLFCKFDIDGMPYEEIYLKSHGDPYNEIAD